VKNPFAGSVAERYHTGRPRHHERTLRRLGFELPRHGVVLDVAGGTGLSTIALQSLGAHAVCIDVSMPMLDVARREVPVLAAAAERLPIRDGGASMVTVSSGVHWFDQDRFFADARRALGPDGVLVVYEHGFLGLPDDDAFQSWAVDVYRARYPTPPRGAYPGELSPDRFTKLGQERFDEPIPYQHDELVRYFMTQSNTVTPVERGDETLEEVAAWLTDATAPFFAERDVRDFTFWGAIEWWAPTAS
jgi:SAM-dependent methyltransferase